MSETMPLKPAEITAKDRESLIQLADSKEDQKLVFRVLDTLEYEKIRADHAETRAEHAVANAEAAVAPALEAARQEAEQAKADAALLREALQLVYDQYGYDWRSYARLVAGMKLERVEKVLAATKKYAEQEDANENDNT